MKKKRKMIGEDVWVVVSCAFSLAIMLTLSGIASQIQWISVLDEDFIEPTNSWEIVKAKEVCWDFSSGAYTVKILEPFRETAVEVPKSRELFDFIIEMDASIVTGLGWFGIMFRFDLSQNESYLVQFSSDGQWRFSVWSADRDFSSPIVVQDWANIPGFCAKETNHFRIIAYRSSIQIYVNDLLLKDITDERLRTGHIKLVAGSYGEVPFQVNFYYLRLLEAYGVRRLAALAERSLWLGESALYEGAFTYAVIEFQVAAQLFQRIDWKEKQALAKSKEAFCWVVLGAYSKAIESFAEALSLCYGYAESFLPRIQWIISDCFLGMGDAYYCLGAYQQAIGCYYQALAYYKALGYAGGVVNALAGLTKCFYAFGEYAMAIYFQTPIPIYSGSAYKDPVYQEGEAWRLLGIGKCYHDLGAYVKAIRKYENALHGFRYARCFHGEALTLIFIANAYVVLGEYEKAFEYFKHAEKVMQRIPPQPGTEFKTGDLENLWRVSDGLARCYLAHGKRDQAVAKMELAITVVEEMRGWIGNPFSRISFIAEKYFLYQNLIPILLETGKIRKSVFYAERAKARTTLDMVETAMKVNPEKLPAVLQAGTDLMRQISALQLGVFLGSFRQNLMNFNFQDIVYELHQKYNAFFLFLETENPVLATLLVVNPEQIQDYFVHVQDNLGQKIVVLEYFVAEEETILWVITRDGIQTASVIPISRAELVDRVREFRKELNTAPSPGEEATRVLRARALGKELYDLLIAPVEKYIQTASHLVIVPSDVLFYLPFGALFRCSGCEEKRELWGGRYLIECYSISYAPSLASLYWPFRHRGEGMYESALVVGNPTGDLKFAAQEAESIASLFERSDLLIGDEATKERVLKLLGEKRYDVVHLSTHGQFDRELPLASKVLLVGGEGLYAGEMMGLRLGEEVDGKWEGCELVVLSACQTGLPPEVKEELVLGDELQGLSQALFVAGTPSAVLTLWNVNDQSTGQLMVEMYKELMGGVPKGEALRRAQLSLLRNPMYRHPHYWAPFVLYGVWR